MPRELIYTSAIQGLLPGSRGFCTVAASPEITRPQLLMLESLSAYRHEFVSGPDTRLNPVAYCHFIVPVTGQTVHVVSRIADSGLDYSRRTNMIAHHLIVLPEEMVRTDPGALAAAPDTFVDQWNSEPVQLPDRSVSPAPLVPGPCRQWAELTGDAGWGGILASAGTTRPVVLVYRPGQSILPLMNEALALLPQSERWKVGFSTFYQKLPPGVVCQWKGVLAGSPEAAVASAFPNALILNCTKPFPSLNPTTETEQYYVEAARTGVLKEKSVVPKKLVVKRVPLATREVAVPVSESHNDMPLEMFTRDSSSESELSSSSANSPMPVASVVDAETMDRLAQLNSIYADMARPQRNNRQFLLRLAIGFLVALLVAAAVVFVFRKEIQDHFLQTIEVSTPSSTSSDATQRPPRTSPPSDVDLSDPADSPSESANTDRVNRP